MLVANNLLNNGTYPMEYGTPVKVWCEGDLKLMGSEVILCLKGINYIHPVRPACVDRGRISSV
jgi:hypothetical protein